MNEEYIKLLQAGIDSQNAEQGTLNEFDCPICKNKGEIFFLDENNNECSRECECMKKRRIIRNTRNSGLSAMLDKYTFDNFSHKENWQFKMYDKATDFIHDDKAKCFFVGGQVGCVDCDTEYFNGKQWVKISEYKTGDKVLQYNPEKREALLTTPKDYICAPSTELYQISCKRRAVDMCLSANHNFAYITSKGHMNKKPFVEVMQMHAEKVQGFYGKVETAFNYTGKGIDLTDNEIRLMCAVIADGYFNPKLKLCAIRVKKERKKERIRMLLNGMRYKEYHCKDGYSQFRFYAPRREKVFTDFWYDCNQEQLKVICDEIFEWDGHKNGKSRMFYSTVKQSADFVQFALSATGRRATVSIDNRKEKPCYVVCASSYNSAVTLCDTHGKNKAKIEKVAPKDGKQYCFTVETGYLILRRNGRIFITGNSGKSHICTAIVGKFLEQGYNVYYNVWNEIVTNLKQNAYDNPEEYNRQLTWLKNVSVLYIDDFFKTTPTTADLDKAFQIIDYRKNMSVSDTKKRFITIVSSEKFISEICEIDEAIGSRIFEMCNRGEYVVEIERSANKNQRVPSQKYIRR